MKIRIKKKSQIASQPILYVLLIIIFAFVLLLGYTFVKDIGKKGEKTTFIFFKSQLASDVESVDYGTVKIETYTVPTNIDKICFSEPNKDTNPLLCSGCPSALEYPIVANAITDKTSENVFLISGSLKETMELDKFTLDCCEFVCMNVDQGKVKLRLEGQGEKTLIKNA